MHQVALKLSYQAYGFGPTTILAFHGFGHPKEDFQFLQKYISENVQIIAIDVPGHGNSLFINNLESIQPITKKDWKRLINQILSENNIESFHLMGYSLGGRIAMVTGELFPNETLSIHLFSPDGLHKSNTFKFANEWKIGRSIFQFLVERIQAVVPIVKLLNNLKILSDTKRKFVLYQLENPERVEKVKIVWSALSTLWPDLNTIFITNNFQKPFQVYFGEKDPIILPQFGKTLQKYSNEGIRIFQLPFGHRTMKPEAIEWLKKNNLWPF